MRQFADSMRRWIAALAITNAGAISGYTHEPCTVPKPIALIEAQSIYSDRAGSQLDTPKVRLNNEFVRPLRAFTTNLAREVDMGAAEDLRCADLMLQQWGSAGALLQQPTSFAATRERQRFGLGITVAAVKLRATGGLLSVTSVGWLRALNAAVMADFARRKVTDNLAVWSASNAAALALIDGDREALRYETEVWQSALEQVRADGFVPSELRRQSRALVYHQYYASALLFLRHLRTALGQSPTPADMDVLRRLINRVEDCLCHPSTMAREAGDIPQEPPSADDFRVGFVLGSDLIDQRWGRCGPEARDTFDATLGGRLDRTRVLLRAQ